MKNNDAYDPDSCDEDYTGQPPDDDQSFIHQPEAGTAASALHLRPVQSAHQKGQAEGWLHHAGGRVCRHP